MNSHNKIAKIAGAGYLVIFLSGIFANFFVLQSLLAPGDAATTARNILENETLFRTGILSFIVMVVFDILLAWALYLFLKPVNKDLSLLSAWLRLVNGTIFGVALYHLLGVLPLLSGSGYLTAFDPAQLQAQVLLSFGAFDQTWLLGLVFFGIHLAVLGYLIIKSDYTPNILGILLIIAAAGYLVDSFAHFLMPNYADYQDVFSMAVVLPGVVGELSFTIWLLVKRF